MIRRIVGVVFVILILVGLGFAARYSGIGGNQASMDITDISTSSDTKSEGTTGNSAQSPVDPIPPLPKEIAETVTPTNSGAISGAEGTNSDDSSMPAPLPEMQSGLEDGPFKLSLPIDCEIGLNCYILSFVNAGTVTEPRDYTCGSLTYDEHRGTDFRLINYVQMEDGVSVKAAAPGTVTKIRDGMPDANFKLFGRAAVTKRGRGNFVAIDHGNGYITSYAHMQRGSITVRPGDEVVRGQVLGSVGMSGLTEFPHVHFEVMKDGLFIDPFTSAARHEGCGITGTPLWTDDVASLLKYPRTLVMRTGFADQVLNRAGVEYSLFNTDPIPTTSTALVFHVYIAGIQPDDGFIAEITDPTGNSFVRSGRRFEDFSMSKLLAIGKQDMTAPLLPGTYTGSFRYFRKDASSGEDIQIMSLTDTVEVQ
ncbi:MAG: M23 family metallopeptidase [Alphaproteobacteria bacterium]|nr:M23 family metallopeptidase [Alphaproteobacteria bacterium]